MIVILEEQRRSTPADVYMCGFAVVVMMSPAVVVVFLMVFPHVVIFTTKWPKCLTNIKKFDKIIMGMLINNKKGEL